MSRINPLSEKPSSPSLSVEDIRALVRLAPMIMLVIALGGCKADPKLAACQIETAKIEGILKGVGIEFEQGETGNLQECLVANERVKGVMKGAAMRSDEIKVQLEAFDIGLSFSIPAGKSHPELSEGDGKSSPGAVRDLGEDPGEPQDLPEIVVLDNARNDIYKDIPSNPYQGHNYPEKTWIACERIKVLKAEIAKIQSDPDFRLKLHRATVLAQHLKSIKARDSFQLEMRNRLVTRRAELVEDLENSSQNYGGDYDLYPSELLEFERGFLPAQGQDPDSLREQIREIDEKIARFDMDIAYETDLQTYKIDPKTGNIVPDTTIPKRRVKVKDEIKNLKLDTDFFVQTELIALYIIEFGRNANSIQNALRNDETGESESIFEKSGLDISLEAPNPNRALNPNFGNGGGGPTGQQ